MLRRVTSYGMRQLNLRCSQLSLHRQPIWSTLTTSGLSTTIGRSFSVESENEHSSTEEIPPRVAVVLSGCGVFDGSEITESVSTLVHLSAAGMKVSCFAPDIPSYHVIDHTRGVVDEEAPRTNVYRESARIARGKITPLSELDVDEYDAIVFPGGFGAAKNLSNFAIKGHKMDVIPDVERIIREFHKQGKPMGFMCIAPVLPARIFGSEVALTVGGDSDEVKWPFHGAAHAIEAMGSKHVVTSLDQICLDKDARIVSSAAYMSGDASPSQVHNNIGKLIDALRDLILLNKSK